MKHLGNLILQAPRLVLLLLAILSFAAIYPALQIRTDFNLEGFYPQDDQVIENYQILEQEFERDDNTLMIGFETDNLFEKEILLDIGALTEQLETVQHVKQVRSLWNAQNIQSDNDQLTFEAYLSQNVLDTADVSRLKEEILSDPLLSGFLVNESGTATVIFVDIRDEDNFYTVRNKVIQSINELLETYRDRYNFKISGIPYYRNQYVNLLNDEIIIYIIISSFLIMMFLWGLYRSVLGVIFPMLIVWATLLMTIAIMQMTGGHLEIMSSTIAPILLCVGVADAIHMISKYDDANEQGLNKRRSIIEMLITLGSATFLTSITTAIGFGTLISSPVVPMQRFGIYTAVGVLIAYFITILFLPASLSLSRREKVFNETGTNLYHFFERILKRISRVNQAHYKKVVLITSLITLIFAAGLRFLSVDGKVFDDISDDTELIQHSRFFSEKLAPPFPMEFIFDTKKEEGVYNPDFIAKLKEFETFLHTFEEVEKTTSVHTIIDRIHEVMQPDSESLPDDFSLIAQYFLLLEINSSDELGRFVDFKYQTARFTALIQDAGSNRVNEMRDQIEIYLKEQFPETGITITGTTILSADLTEKIVYSMAWSILLAIAAVSFIMAMLFKNYKFVLLSMVPNLVPLIITGGILGWAGIDIKPSTAVIFAIALGIAVDDSIHYLARFRIEYGKTGDMVTSLSRTTVKTGRAIIITSLIIVAGFASLLTSTFTSTVLMGALVGVTILGALMADLFLLPSLFYWIKPKLSVRKDASEEFSQSPRE